MVSDFLFFSSHYTVILSAPLHLCFFDSCVYILHLFFSAVNSDQLLSTTKEGSEALERYRTLLKYCKWYACVFSLFCLCFWVYGYTFALSGRKQTIHA